MSLNVTSMIDAPCGAMEWQARLLPLLAANVRPRFRYLGLDVSQTVLSKNANSRALQKLSSFARFARADLIESAVPSGYELILSRDALQAALPHVRSSREAALVPNLEGCA